MKPSEHIKARCANCGKERGDHKARTYNCPRQKQEAIRGPWSKKVFKWDGKAMKIAKSPLEPKERKTIEERYQEFLKKESQNADK